MTSRCVVLQLTHENAELKNEVEAMRTCERVLENEEFQHSIDAFMNRTKMLVEILRERGYAQ